MEKVTIGDAELYLGDCLEILPPLQECRAALDALRQAAKEAAEHLRHEAAELKRAHTISGEWDGTEPEAMAECKRLMALAGRLQANAPNSADA